MQRVSPIYWYFCTRLHDGTSNENSLFHVMPQNKFPDRVCTRTWALAPTGHRPVLFGSQSTVRLAAVVSHAATGIQTRHNGKISFSRCCRLWKNSWVYLKRKKFTNIANRIYVHFAMNRMIIDPANRPYPSWQSGLLVKCAPMHSGPMYAAVSSCAAQCPLIMMNGKLQRI